MSAPVWRGAYEPHAHLSAKNIVNALLCATVALPSILLTDYLFKHPELCGPRSSVTIWPPALNTQYLCQIAYYEPIFYTNVLFFLNCVVLFWVIGLVQRSFWLIDPYWQFVPLLLVWFYDVHPLRASLRAPNARHTLADALLIVWAIRLTYNYFRREEWKFGQREDWRYTKMSRDAPRAWTFVSFFAVGVAQWPLLMGITLPLYSAAFGDSPVNAKVVPLTAVDYLAGVSGLIGIIVAHFADTQLFEYMSLKNKPPLLNSGLWRYSRHPNYFGEQLWWWSFGVFSVTVGHAWALAGTAINSVVLAVVTHMTENRMLKNWTAERKKLYENYRRNTSVWLPLPPQVDRKRD